MYALVGLLMFRFDSNVMKLKLFLNTLDKISDKQYNKCNTLYVHAPPPCKFWQKLFLSFARFVFPKPCFIISPSRNERFPFTGDLARRINIWNEARLDPYYTEDINQIMAGDRSEVQVKNHPPRILEKTPLIVLSDREVFPEKRAFKIHYKKYAWRPCQFFARCRRKPNPVRVGILMC